MCFALLGHVADDVACHGPPRGMIVPSGKSVTTACLT